MREGWKEVELEELGTIGRGKSRHRPRNADFLYGNEYPFVQTADVKAAEYKITSYSQMYSEAGLTQSKLWPINTLCITIAANIADSSILGIEACFPDSVLGFISDPLKSDVKFVKYLFDMLQIRIKQISQGAAQDNLSLEKIRTLRFTVPNVETQRKIATILSGYDDLIENNLKRIKILEEMAQQTYEEWFVRMRFPGYETAVMNEETGLPEGWEKVKLGEYLNFKKGKKVEELYESKEDGTEKVLLLDSLESGKFNFTKIGKHELVKRGDILMLMDGARSSYVFQADSGIIGSTLAKVDLKKIPSSFMFYYFQNNLEWLQINNTGAAIPHSNPKFIKSINFKLPVEKILLLWENFANPILDNIWNLKDQNQRLREARDLLLPRLMMGIVEV